MPRYSRARSAESGRPRAFAARSSIPAEYAATYYCHYARANVHLKSGVVDNVAVTPADFEPHSIVVHIPEPGREARRRSRHTERLGHVGERPIAIVAVQPVGLPVVGDVQVRPAVAIVVSPDHALRVPKVLHAGLGGDVRERAIALVPEQLTGSPQLVGRFVADIQIQVPVVVVVGPRRFRAGAGAVLHARAGRDVGECTVAIVLVEEVGGSAL